ncbi:GMC oxidoreductase [Streptomyces mirabilis]
MTDAQHYDVIVVGTGAGGGTLAHRLAPTGKRILLLERGDYLPRERDNWDSTAVRHHDGISPAWPLNYEELEPYYTQAEHLYLVHGRHGEDPTEGPTSAQYAYPPVQHEPRIQQLSHDLEKQGLHPFHLPIGVNLSEDDRGRATHTSACIRCDRVDGFPCLVGAKSDAQVICVDPALEHDNVEMVTNGGGEGSTVEFSADINSSDVVGRHGWYPGSDDWEYPLGGIQMLGKSDSEQIHGEAPRWAGALAPDMPFEVLAHHAVDCWLCGEDLPTPENRVRLDRDSGIHLALDEKNNIAGLNHLRHKLPGTLSHLGMHAHPLLSRSIYLHKGMPIGATAHQAGTVRFGRAPADSALDVDCKAHDLDSLYVVDTSFFPSIAAVDPSLPAIANALRVGDRVADRLR